MAGRRQNGPKKLKRSVVALKEHQNERPNWSEVWRNAAAAGVFVVLAAIAVPITNHLLKDQKNPCSIVYGEVAKAVEAGIDDPENLEPLANDGCARSPAEVAEDILDN